MAVRNNVVILIGGRASDWNEFRAIIKQESKKTVLVIGVNWSVLSGRYVEPSVVWVRIKGK